MWAGHLVTCALLDGFTGREVRLLVHSNRSALPTCALYGLAAFTVSVRGTSSPTSASPPLQACVQNHGSRSPAIGEQKQFAWP